MRDEEARLADVHRYDILDTPPDGAFDRVTTLAARLFGVPIAIISIVDRDRIWFKSHHGTEVDQIGREPGLYLYTSAVMQSDHGQQPTPRFLIDSVVCPRDGEHCAVDGGKGRLQFVRDGCRVGADLFKPLLFASRRVPELQFVDHDRREILKRRHLLVSQRARLPVDHAQGAEVEAVGAGQRGGRVEAEPRLAGDERVCGQLRVEALVRVDKGVASSSTGSGSRTARTGSCASAATQAASRRSWSLPCFDLAVHHDREAGVVVLEYASEGRVVDSGAAYGNRYISVLTVLGPQGHAVARLSRPHRSLRRDWLAEPQLTRRRDLAFRGARRITSAGRPPPATQF